CVPFSCLPHLLEHQAQRIPDSPTILAPGRAPLIYSRLYQHVEKLGRALRGMGIGRRDRTARRLQRNGPSIIAAESVDKVCHRRFLVRFLLCSVLGLAASISAAVKSICALSSAR